MSGTKEASQNLRSTASDGEIDLRAYWRVVVGRRWLVAGIFAATVLGTLLVTLRQTRMYSATTTIIIDISAPRLLNREQVQDVVESGSGNFWSSKEYYETQYKVLTSHSVASRVVEKLQLARDARFLGLDGVTDEAKRAAAMARVDASEVLRRRLAVNPVKDSRVVRIQVDDRDPRWAATLADAVAEAYIEENLSVRSTTTQNASAWLEQQLADLETKLAKSADALFRFKQSHDIVATSWDDRQSMVSQRLAAVNDALTRTRVSRAQLESRTEQINALSDELANGDPSADAFAVVNQSRTIQDLKVKYFETKIECADADVAYLDRHPKRASCVARLEAARAGLLQEMRTIIDSARREYEETVQTEKKLRAMLNETKADAFSLNQHEKEYLELKRSHDNNQRLYDLVLQRLKETGVTGMIQMSNVRVLDRAEIPVSPSSPKPIRNVGIAAFFAIIAGVGFAFLLESLDTSVSTREQVEERLGLPFLGIIPAIQLEDEGTTRDLYVHSNPHSAPAECLRSIRTNLLFMSPERPLKTILVTSSGPGEGKTTTAASLAEIMADGGNRVLLMEADMRRPRLQGAFGIRSADGLSSLILGQRTLGEVARPTSIENLSVLACGPIPPNPAELLHTEAFKAILADAAQRYDRVIIDSPPAGLVADSVVISTLVDGTLFVLRSGETSRDAAARAIRTLTDVNARVFGAVLNNANLASGRYAQYSTYYRYGYADGGTRDAANERSPIG